ncbi:MAG TPA: hypothetical protein VGJ87_01030 [Roseiflexaceae bacterium]
MFILASIILLSIPWLPVARSTAQAALAAVPTPIFSDKISGFELYQKGVFWWHTLGIFGCPAGEFYNAASIKLQGNVGMSTRTLEDNRCPILYGTLGNVVRDSLYLYYFEDKQLVRKAVNAAASDPTTPLTQAPPLPSPYSSEALAIDDAGRLYWSTNNSGTLTIWRMKADNSEAPTVFTSLNTAGEIRHLMTYRYGAVDGIAFIENGNLWRYNNNVASPLLLGSNVRDFWVRTSQVGAFSTATFYAARDTGLFRITNSGSSTQIYTPSTNNPTTIDSVTTDDQNIYLVEGVYLCPPGQFCPEPVRSLYRRALSAADNTSWDLIVAQEGGTNLRSDGQYLFFKTGSAYSTINELKKVATDVPPVQIDVEALDLEVTQAIQNMKEGFDLVAGHPTVVRGYARLATSADATAYLVGATLTGKLNGQPLPGSPLLPLKSVAVYATTKQFMRDNSAFTFLFELPESWVKDDLPLVKDQLTLEMTVNPVGALPENVGANPLANNKVSATALVRHSTRPCLMMIPVRADHMPVLDHEPPGLFTAVARARSLMPLRDFRVFTNYSSTDLEDNWILSENGNSGEGYDMNHSNNDPDDDDSDGALSDLDDLDAWSWEWQTCSDLHWLGMLHPDAPVWFGGISNRNDNVLLAKINNGAGGIIAHELGHNYGRRHINCGEFPPGADNFDLTPYNPCHLYFTYFPLEATYYGFDFFDLNNVQVKRPQDHPDIMSYASHKWPGYVYWLELMTAIPNFDEGASLNKMTSQTQAAQIVASATGDMLYVGGELNLDADTASFNTVYHVPDGVAPPAKMAQSLQAQQAAALEPQHTAAGAVIRQLNASDIVLSQTSVMTKELSLHSGGQHRYSFGQYIPLNPQTKKVQLMHDGLVLAERVASSHAPVLTLAAPVLDNAAGTIALSWSASDSDGDALHALILYSNDDGAHWLPLDKNVTGLEAKFNTQGLAGGANARLRLIVDDGFNTAIATSSPFVINKHAPTPAIDGIVEQQRLPYTATTTLYGLASDAEEGSLDGEALTWSLSGPSSRAYSGTQVILAGLAPGQYSMTLSAKDSDGMTGAISKHFEVLPAPVPEGNAPALDGLCSDAAYAGAVVVALDQAGAQASLIHSGSTLYACFTGLKLGAGSTMNVAGLRVDANNSKDAIAQGDDRGFFVDEEGIPFQTVGNGSDMPVTLAPAPGYAASVAYNNAGWSAEMRIAEALVGGWGHAAGVLFQYDVINHADNANNWPEGGSYNQPSSWATALFGAEVALGNRAPIANAGGDQIHALSKPTIIALDSSASYDPDLDSITPTWSQTAGPSVTLTEPTTSTIRFTANPVSVPTVLRFQLTVSDGKVSSSPDEVEITLLPAKPIMGGLHKTYLPLVVK